MATVIFSAIGTLVGGPLGGAIGALAGSQVDRAIIGSPSREGPRLKELGVTTSSYGTPIARHFGHMRVPGTIVWATDLVEHRKRSGGGKGRPKVTNYSYTTSFAVALSSRPIRGVGRIWADGNLLRGAGGDLKTAGDFRLHLGHADQLPDPLIAAKEGAGHCPAFRGTAYAVFEDLELGDFGNRIPALTFEVFADDGALSLATLAEGLIDDADLAVPLPGLAGFSAEGPLADTLALLDPVWPMDCDAGGTALTIARERLQGAPVVLPEPAVAVADGDFGAGDFGRGEGLARRTGAAPAARLDTLRYYDVARDYQPGLQRASGRAPEGQPAGIELPAALAADDARSLVESAARRARWARDTLAWRCCELDAEVAPGAVVAAPGQPGLWRVTDWEWRASGVELQMTRLAPTSAFALPDVDPGRPNPAPDLPAGETVLAAFELPWDGTGSGDLPAVFAALSSPGARWTGAALFADQGDGDLVPLGPSGRTRSAMGAAVDVLPAGSPLLFDRASAVTVALAGPDLTLPTATPRQLAMGANRALLGEEMIQFASATPLGGGLWRLENLLRGRGGSEHAIGGHAAGERFVLLDDAPVALDAAAVGSAAGTLIAAIGLGDTEPVTAPIACRGWILRPPAPVHARRAALPGGGLALSWTRRSRGAWAWSDGIDVPLGEEAEAYLVTYGPVAAPLALWETAAPRLELDAAALAGLPAGGAFHVRQRGSHALSQPLLLFTLT